MGKDINKIKIVSKGTSYETEIFTSNGDRLNNVTKIEILPIENNTGLIEARLTFENVELDIEATVK